MIRMISGVCALGLLVGSYFVCPEGLQDRIHEAMTPSEELVAEVKSGLDAIADHFKGPGDFYPEDAATVRLASADAE